jgi:hypothetical protein
MARPYSEKFLISLQHLDSSRLGIKLGKICVKANLPTIYVADAFNVSRMTVYSWFRGKPLRDKNSTRVENFISMVEEGLANGVLPAATLPEAKEFIEANKVV